MSFFPNVQTDTHQTCVLYIMVIARYWLVTFFNNLSEHQSFAEDLPNCQTQQKLTPLNWFQTEAMAKTYEEWVKSG